MTVLTKSTARFSTSRKGESLVGGSVTRVRSGTKCINRSDRWVGGARTRVVGGNPKEQLVVGPESEGIAERMALSNDMTVLGT